MEYKSRKNREMKQNERVGEKKENKIWLKKLSSKESKEEENSIMRLKWFFSFHFPMWVYHTQINVMVIWFIKWIVALNVCILFLNGLFHLKFIAFSWCWNFFRFIYLFLFLILHSVPSIFPFKSISNRKSWFFMFKIDFNENERKKLVRFVHFNFVK